MGIDETNNKKQLWIGEAYKIGFLLIGAGCLILLDQRLNTGWLTLAIPAIAGLLITLYGAVRRMPGWTIGGTVLLGAGLGLILGLFVLKERPPLERAGMGLLAFAAGWLLLSVLVGWIKKGVQWWSLVVTAVISASGIYLAFTPEAGLFMFLVLLTTCLGFILLAWGIIRKLIGLVIAGCIILSVAPAFYYSWVINADHANLVKIGTMLVWLALGWFMISFFGRIVFQKFIWWPIIPGGVLAMVGWGLYIGGAAGKELGFISNTGSVALILFGIYLILLKYGLRK
jgi:hypothetical protein